METTTILIRQSAEREIEIGVDKIGVNVDHEVQAPPYWWRSPEGEDRWSQFRGELACLAFEERPLAIIGMNEERALINTLTPSVSFRSTSSASTASDQRRSGPSPIRQKLRNLLKKLDPLPQQSSDGYCAVCYERGPRAILQQFAADGQFELNGILFAGIADCDVGRLRRVAWATSLNYAEPKGNPKAVGEEVLFCREDGYRILWWNPHKGVHEVYEALDRLCQSFGWQALLATQ